MKKQIVGALLTALAMGSSPAWSRQMPLYDLRPKISVGGDAVVNVTPDRIVIGLGIETSDPEISAAKQKNDEIVKKTIAAIKGFDIPDGDVQTEHSSLQPCWNPDYPRVPTKTYIARSSLVVTVNDPAKAEELVASALQAGVNFIHGIDYQTTELKKYREQARDLALKAAKEKADKMAAALGQTVGDPIQIGEGYSGSPGCYSSNWWGWDRGSSRRVLSQISVQEPAGRSDVPDTIALGQIAIRASVYVTFLLKK